MSSCVCSAVRSPGNAGCTQRRASSLHPYGRVGVCVLARVNWLCGGGRLAGSTRMRQLPVKFHVMLSLLPEKEHPGNRPRIAGAATRWGRGSWWRGSAGGPGPGGLGRGGAVGCSAQDTLCRASIEERLDLWAPPSLLGGAYQSRQRHRHGVQAKAARPCTARNRGSLGVIAWETPDKHSWVVLNWGGAHTTRCLPVGNSAAIIRIMPQAFDALRVEPQVGEPEVKRSVRRRHARPWAA